MLTDARAAARADGLLSTPDVRARATPALLIAYELRKAATCAARVPLLDRAIEVGDERSVAILQPLGVSSKRGCGKKKRMPCPAACPAEAERYLDAVSKIKARPGPKPR
jgi:hypothetical protein